LFVNKQVRRRRWQFQIENVAATLLMNVDSVRSINLHTYTSLKEFYDSCGEPLEYTMPLIWNKLAFSANYEV